MSNSLSSKYILSLPQCVVNKPYVSTFNNFSEIHYCSTLLGLNVSTNVVSVGAGAFRMGREGIQYVRMWLMTRRKTDSTHVARYVH